MPTGDPLRKVTPGEPFGMQAATYNAFVDAALAARRPGRQGPPSLDASTPAPGLVLVLNSSGSDLDRFAVLGVDGPAIDPADNADGFAERPALTGVAPTADHVGGRFVVLLEPIASGAVGLACAGAVTVCKVNVSDAGHRFADVAAGTTAALVSAATGPVQLLYQQAGTGSGKWAVGRFGGGGGMIRVRITGDGGYAGGYYSGKLTKLPSGPIDPTVDLIGTALGADGADCVVVNAQELGVGANSHWISASGTSQQYFTGTVIGATAAGLPVVQVEAAAFEECSS